MKTLKQEIQDIELKDIVADANQPRKFFDSTKIRYLKDSIQKYGIMNPLTVEKVEEKYLLVDGERRLRAATELKLKDVPCVVIAPQTAVDRLIQQFHIQEQHEGWTSTEKAVTVNELAKEMKLSLVELGQMLGLEVSTIKRYVAFSSLLEKKEFAKSEIGIEWATPMNAIANISEKLYMDKLKEPFTQNMRRKIERNIISQIKSGELKIPNNLTKLKDAFIKEPKAIETFITKNTGVAELFLKTKAQDAYRLRNASNSGSYMTTHINHYLETADALPTPNQMQTFKMAKRALEALLARVEK